MRVILTIAAALVLTGTAAAQYPTQPLPGPQYGPMLNPNNFAPNFFNPQTQPLSPYLNLLGQGANPAVDYYYRVRPGTVGMAPRGFGGAPFVAPGGNRPVFFPQLAQAPDPLGAGPSGQPGDVLPPAGHGVVFGNTMGFFPSAFGQAGGARSGLAGVGASRPRR
jgi:hypothetical protein